MPLILPAQTFCRKGRFVLKVFFENEYPVEKRVGK